MCASNGPVSTLPGSRLQPDLNSFCETEGHEDRPAFRKIQGETDSFGCEYIHLCESCVEELKNDKIEGQCDWCKKGSDDLKYRRDFEEGSCGRVYLVCIPCIVEENKRLDEELRSSGNDYYESTDDSEDESQDFWYEDEDYEDAIHFDERDEKLDEGEWGREEQYWNDVHNMAQHDPHEDPELEADNVDGEGFEENKEAYWDDVQGMVQHDLREEETSNADTYNAVKEFAENATVVLGTAKVHGADSVFLPLILSREVAVLQTPFKNLKARREYSFEELQAQANCAGLPSFELTLVDYPTLLDSQDANLDVSVISDNEPQKPKAWETELEAQKLGRLTRLAPNVAVHHHIHGYGYIKKN